MEDKELFEKVEKAFGITENKKIQKIYESGNFKKQLDEVVTSKSPTAGGGNLLGAIGKGIGAVTRSIPGTRGFKMRSAEARAATAKARQEELKAQQMQQDVMSGKGFDKKGKGPTDEFTKKIYDRDIDYKTAYDKRAAGKELNARDEAAIARVQKLIDDNFAKQEQEKGAQKQKEQTRQSVKAEAEQLIGAAAPTIETKLSKDDKEKLVNFILNKEDIKLNDKEISQLGTKLVKIARENKKMGELKQLKTSISRQRALVGSPDLIKKFQAATPLTQPKDQTTDPAPKPVQQSAKKERAIEQKRLGNEKMTAEEFRALQRKTAGTFSANDVVELDGKQGKFVKYTVKKGKATVRIPAKTKQGYKDVEVFPTKLKKSQQQELGGIDNGATSKPKPKSKPTRRQKTVDEIGKETQKIIDKQPKVPDSAIPNRDERAGDKEQRLKDKKGFKNPFGHDERLKRKKKRIEQLRADKETKSLEDDLSSIKRKRKELKAKDKEEKEKAREEKAKARAKKKKPTPLKSKKEIDKDAKKDLVNKFTNLKPTTGKVNKPPLL